MNIFQNAKKIIQTIYFSNTRHSKLNYFEISIPKTHYIMLIIFMLIIFFINIFIKYQIFLDLKQGRSFEATIINHYSKSKNSDRFKLQDSNGNVFYATYRGKFKKLNGMKARVYGKIYKCSFIRFLKSCNIYHSTLSLLPKDSINKFFTKIIDRQHDNLLYANLYNALFFAETLEKPLRDTATALGLAHLIAISGFHLAALTLMFYIFISPLYFIFHRYFCYRNAFYDLGFLGLVFGFLYLCLIDFEPSFLRAYIMACVGYVIMLCGIRIFSFLNLFLCVLLAISLNPSLIFHIGFTLSVCGVYFIFLFVAYMQRFLKRGLSKILIGFIAFDFIIFFQMMPIVHYFFPYFSPYQLVSIPLSMAFFILFPILFFSHIIGHGYMFDNIIHLAVEHDFFMSQFFTPNIFLIFYLAFSLLAIYSKYAYITSIILSIGFYIYNLYLYIGLV